MTNELQPVSWPIKEQCNVHEPDEKPTTAYTLTDIPRDQWDEAKQRAIREHKTLKEVLLACVAFYAAHGLPDPR